MLLGIIHVTIQKLTKRQVFTRSILCIPLTYQGKVLGALQLLNRVDGDFTEKDVDQAMSIASVIALAIQLMHCNEVRE